MISSRLVASSVAGLLVASVFAVPTTAQAFRRSVATPPEGGREEVCLFWRSRTVPYWVNSKGSKDAPAAKDAIRRSFSAWMGPDCTDLVFEYQGETDRIDVGFDQDASNNINLVIFRDVDCDRVAPATDPCWDETPAGLCANKYNCWEQSPETIGLTTTTFSFASGELLDADIELNGAGFLFTTANTQCPADGSVAPPACAATDIENTLVHEVGHFLGLDHVEERNSTMYKSAEQGELLKRTLAPDDIDGVCFIYPKGAPTRTCGGAQATPNPPDNGGCGCTSASSAGSVPAMLGLTALALGSAGATRRRRRLRIPGADDASSVHPIHERAPEGRAPRDDR